MRNIHDFEVKNMLRMANEARGQSICALFQLPRGRMPERGNRRLLPWMQH